MANEIQLIQRAMSDPLMRKASELGLFYIRDNPDESPLLEGQYFGDVYTRVCLMPALDYLSRYQDPKKEAMLYFLAYPALEHMPRAAVHKQFGDAVADLNEEIKTYTLEIEGKIAVDHNRKLSSLATDVLNVFKHAASPEAIEPADSFRDFAYTSQLNQFKPTSKPS